MVFGGSTSSKDIIFRKSLSESPDPSSDPGPNPGPGPGSDLGFGG